jgi:hypothetical protein
VSAVRGKGAAAPNPIERAAGVLRDARNALRDAIHPPLSRVRPMKPYAVPGLKGVKVSATPVAARGPVITWRVTVERGGAMAGAFETRLTRQQLGPAQFRAQADGTASPLRRQVADVLRAPQKRLVELGSRVDLRNAPGGANLQATIVAKQEYRDGAWRHVEYAVGQVKRYTWDPVHPGQKREALGYHRTSIGRGETIRMPDGSRPKTLEEAAARVEKMLEHRALTPVSASGARAAAEIRDTQQRALQDLSARIGATARPGAGSWTGVQLRPWTSPVAMPGKAFREWTPADRVGYTVQVAKQHLPAELGKQLQELMTPQTAQALAAYGAAHLVGVGFVADAALLGLSGPGAVEGTRAFGRYLQTTMRAEHPMELVTAGRELSEIAAPLVVDGGTMLGAFGVSRAVRGLKPAQAGALARSGGAGGAGGVAKPGEPPASLLQWELARDPLRALSTLRQRVEQGGVRPRREDVLFAMQTAQQAYRDGARGDAAASAAARAAAKTEITPHFEWAQSLLDRMMPAGRGAPRGASTPPTRADAPGGRGGALARADALADALGVPAAAARAGAPVAFLATRPGPGVAPTQPAVAQPAPQPAQPPAGESAIPVDAPRRWRTLAERIDAVADVGAVAARLADTPDPGALTAAQRHARTLQQAMKMLHGERGQVEGRHAWTVRRDEVLGRRIERLQAKADAAPDAGAERIGRELAVLERRRERLAPPLASRQAQLDWIDAQTGRLEDAFATLQAGVKAADTHLQRPRATVLPALQAKVDARTAMPLPRVEKRERPSAGWNALAERLPPAFRPAAAGLADTAWRLTAGGGPQTLIPALASDVNALLKPSVARNQARWETSLPVAATAAQLSKLEALLGERLQGLRSGEASRPVPVPGLASDLRRAADGLQAQGDRLVRLSRLQAALEATAATTRGRAFGDWGPGVAQRLSASLRKLSEEPGVSADRPMKAAIDGALTRLHPDAATRGPSAATLAEVGTDLFDFVRTQGAQAGLPDADGAAYTRRGLQRAGSATRELARGLSEALPAAGTEISLADAHRLQAWLQGRRERLDRGSPQGVYDLLIGKPLVEQATHLVPATTRYGIQTGFEQALLSPPGRWTLGALDGTRQGFDRLVTGPLNDGWALTRTGAARLTAPMSQTAMDAAGLPGQAVGLALRGQKLAVGTAATAMTWAAATGQAGYFVNNAYFPQIYNFPANSPNLTLYSEALGTPLSITLGANGPYWKLPMGIAERFGETGLPWQMRSGPDVYAGGRSAEVMAPAILRGGVVYLGTSVGDPAGISARNVDFYAPGNVLAYPFTRIMMNVKGNDFTPYLPLVISPMGSPLAPIHYNLSSLNVGPVAAVNRWMSPVDQGFVGVPFGNTLLTPQKWVYTVPPGADGVNLVTGKGNAPGIAAWATSAHGDSLAGLYGLNAMYFNKGAKAPTMKDATPLSGLPREAAAGLSLLTVLGGALATLRYRLENPPSDPPSPAR